MKTKVCILAVAMALMVPFMLSAQNVKDTVVVGKDFRYVGQWPEGQGVRYTSGGVLKGYFIEGKAEGICSSISYDRSQKYYGNYKNGRRDGYGRQARSYGFFYEGDFKDGYPEGNGTMFFSDGYVFKGTFHLGKPLEGQYYYFKTKAEFKERLPEIPELELTKEHKKILKRLRKSKDNDSSQDEESDKVDPMFLGGDANMFSKWVNGNLVYPMSAKHTKSEGKVVIRFTVSETGELANPYVVQGSGITALDCEALRVVQKSPDWTPGMIDGKEVSVSYTFPVYFMLRGE